MNGTMFRSASSLGADRFQPAPRLDQTSPWQRPSPTRQSPWQKPTASRQSPWQRPTQTRQSPWQQATQSTRSPWQGSSTLGQKRQPPPGVCCQLDQAGNTVCSDGNIYPAG